MPLGSPTCTIRPTSFMFYPTQRVQYRFRVSAQENIKLPTSSGVFSNTKRAQAALNLPGRIEVNVHTAFEQHTTTQTVTNDHDSYNGANEQVHEKPDV
jgi:hypothetical protein